MRVLSMEEMELVAGGCGERGAPPAPVKGGCGHSTGYSDPHSGDCGQQHQCGPVVTTKPPVTTPPVTTPPVTTPTPVA